MLPATQTVYRVTLPFQKHFHIHISLAPHDNLRGKREGDDNSILPMETRKVKNLVQGHTAKDSKLNSVQLTSNDHHPQVFPHDTTHTENWQNKQKKKITCIYQGKKSISEVNLVQIFMSPIK